jgi:hypothetical protein
MAIKKVIEIDVDQVQAMGGLDALQQSLGEVEKKTTSLRTEYRKAQQEVARLSDEFGATSKQAIEAAKRAGELGDKIADAKALTDAFNPDAKFNALSSSLSGVASGFAAYQGALGLVGVESKEVEQQLLKVQSALALSQGLQGLGEAKDSFKQLKAVAVNAFNGIKAAIGSTGIGLLVIALGTIATYWDDIKETVSGVSSEQKKLNTQLNESAKKSKESLDTLNAQDETLKRQGKTEREILQLKQKQTQEAINQQIKAIENNIQLRKVAEETSQRNKEILKGILDFVAAPIVSLLKGIDAIGERFGKTFGLAEGFKNFTSELIFDPKEVKEKGEQASKEEQKILNDLINQRDGYANQIKAIDDKTNEEAKRKADERLKISEEEYKRLQELQNQRGRSAEAEYDALLKLEADARERNRVAGLTELEQVQQKYDAQIEALKQAGISTVELEIEKANAINDINLKQQALEEEQRLKRELALTAQTFGKIAEIAGRNSKIGKAFAVGQALINTYQGITAELQTKAVTPYEIGLKVANIAFVASTGFKAVKQILATNPMSSGGGSASSASVGGGGASATPQFNLVGQSSTNQLTATIAGQQNQPIQTYVVGSQVTSQQALDRNAVANSVFG